MADISHDSEETGRDAVEWPETTVKFPWAKEEQMSNLKAVVILTEGIRGHLNQSRGVAAWLARRTGAEILEIEVPIPSGVRKRTVRAAARRLLAGNRRKARDWLALADGENVIRELGRWLAARDIREGEPQSLILLSAGTLPAFFNAALGYIWRCTCVTIMTPSIIGTAPFDFAIVPEHDHPKDLSNVLTTIGAPNMIVREELGGVARSLLHGYPAQGVRSWGVLIGGDDDNYRITAGWVRSQIGRLLREAERNQIDLYIATSRRTSKEAETALRRLAANCLNVRFLLFASEDQYNPVPAMLGACDEIFTTDDSVNMVSEAVTAGHRVVLMRTERAGRVKPVLQRAISGLVRAGLLPKRALWGIPRFDRTFASFEKMGLLIDFKDWLRERRRGDLPMQSQGLSSDVDEEGFNEARRAADWILENLGDVTRQGEED